MGTSDCVSINAPGLNLYPPASFYSLVNAYYYYYWAKSDKNTDELIQ